jgi:glutamine amidotransferase
VIALIDYRAGNLTSVRKAFAALGAELYDPASAADLVRARAIVVPGVGHFGATAALDDTWTTAIRSHLDRGTPLLGICLGLQWLFAGSTEAPECPGLGILSGTCYRLKGSPDGRGGAEAIKVPHVGWNSLTIRSDAPIVAGVTSGAQVYFTHSYVAPVTAETVAVTDHGGPFASIVQRGRVAGVQFHPEKSGDVGLQVLRNFLSLVRE